MTPPTPIYHDPSPGTTRSRRSSSRMSVASPLSRCNSNQELLRAAGAIDAEAFTYDTKFLKDWIMEDDKLWHRLPANLRSHLAAMQHAGAAALTAFDRLDQHPHTFEGDEVESKVSEADLPEHFDALPSPKLRSVSNASSVFSNGLPSPPSTASPVSSSGCATPMELSFSSSQNMTPFSPISLGPSARDSFDRRGTASVNRSFSNNSEPQEKFYKNEVAYLRSEALPHLRHAGRKIDIEWAEVKKISRVSLDDVALFEAWWQNKKQAIAHLDDDGKRLASKVDLDATGMGWTAP